MWGGTSKVALDRGARAWTVARIVGVFLTASAMVLPVAQASWGVSGAPATLHVARTGADSTDLQITWSAVGGVDHYTVNVFDGTTDDATTIPSGTTAFVYDGTGACNRYRVTVTAVKPDGQSASTGEYWVPSLAPYSVSNLSWNGKGDEQPSQLTWSPPTIRSEKPVTEYDVLVTALNNGRQILTEKTTGTSIAIPGLDANRVYKARVQARNEFGTCASPKLLLRGAKTTMTPPSGLVAKRDAAVPAVVDVSWKAPSWKGSNDVTGYEVAYSTGAGKPNWELVTRAKDTSLQLNLDPTRDWDFQVRAVGSGKASSLTKPVTVYKVGSTGKPELDPAVTIRSSGARVVVEVDGPVGSNSKYPKLDVTITPTLSDARFRDRHVVSNRATRVVFGDVPCGVYTVQVTGKGSGGTKEFGRTVLDLCNTDLMKASDWKLVGGRADISGNTVFLDYGSRVLSLRPRTSGDMVFVSDVNYEQGNGWGVWTRSTWAGAVVTSGYTFQYDKGQGNNFIIRVWNADKECTTPIAQTKFPSTLSIFGKHHIVLVVSGDSLYATVDGIRMFDVPSLTTAVTSSKCGMPVPQGNQVALRTWNVDTRVTFTDTTLR